MKNLKQMLAFVLALAMVMSYMVLPVSADEVTGTGCLETCTAEAHAEGCPNAVVTCTGSADVADCQAQTHTGSCPKAVVICTGAADVADCQAQTHTGSCPKAVVICTGAADVANCQAQTHTGSCPKAVVICTGAADVADCQAQTHTGDCPKAAPAVEEEEEQTAPAVCTENEECTLTAGHKNTCPKFVACTIYAGNCVLENGHDGGCKLNCGCPAEGGVHIEGCALALYAELDPVASVNGTEYTDLPAALKALTDGATLTLLDDITITEKWDERNEGAKITANNVTIDGNGKKITFSGEVNDGGNYHCAFRVVGSGVTFQNLTLDMSNASGSGNWLRAISSNAGDLTVNGCTFIGNASLSNTRAIIFGEGAQHSPDTDIEITNCNFSNWRYGITDNENGKDMGTVEVTGNSFSNAGAQLSASKSIVFTGNSVSGAYVSITAYSNPENLTVTATGNTLTANTENKYNKIKGGTTVDAQEEFKIIPVGTITVGYVSDPYYNNVAAIWGEATSNAKESFVIKIYSGETLVCTLTLNDLAAAAKNTWHAALSDDGDTYWTAVWEDGHPVANAQPDKVVLYVDDVEVDDNEVQMNRPDGLIPVVWKEVEGVNPTPVATIERDGKTLRYGTLAAALDDAQDGETITLIDNGEPIPANGKVVGKTVTITGDATFNWTAGWLFVGRGGAGGDGKLIFSNANIKATGGGDKGIHVSAPDGEANKFFGEVEFNNSNVELSYLINRNKMTVNNSTLTVISGFGVYGRPAKENPAGVNGTATMDVNSGSTVIVKNPNGMGIGHESNGILNINGGAFISNNEFDVHKDSVLNINGGSFTVSTKLDVLEGGTVNVKGGTLAAATMSNNGTTNVSGTSKLNITALNGKNEIKLADGTTLNASTVGGTVSAGGNVTFTGANTVKTFGAGSGNTITIGAGASLHINDTNRLTVGYGNVFNITGSVSDAKSADKSAVTPSLQVDGGITIPVGSKPAMNISNAYVVIGTGNATASKSGAAFALTANNSILDFNKNLKLYGASDVTLTNSAVNVAGHLVFDHADCNVEMNNSKVAVTNSFKNSGTLNLKNGAELNVAGQIQPGENGGMPGTIHVDNATLKIFCSSVGHAVDGNDTGKLKLTNGAKAEIGYLTKIAVEMDTTSLLTATQVMDTCSVTIDCSKLTEEEYKVKVVEASHTAKFAGDVETTLPEDSEIKVETLLGDDGDITIINVPKLPSATVTEIPSPADPALTFALNFKADEATEAQLDYYGDWHADYVLTINKDVTFNANGGADGYLAGQYDAYSENWVSVPFSDEKMNAGESLKIMEYARLPLTYREVYNFVKDFDCGIFFTDEFLAKNVKDLKVTLELRMYNPEDENESYVIGGDEGTFVFEAPYGAVIDTNRDGKISDGDDRYFDLASAMEAVQNGQTIILNENQTLAATVTNTHSISIDLNGKTVTGPAADYAIENKGTLNISNGTINSGKGILNQAGAAVTVTNVAINPSVSDSGAAVYNYGTANIVSGTFGTAKNALSNNGKGATMTISGGTINGRVYVGPDAKLTVNGGTIASAGTAYGAVYADKGATVTISGGTITNSGKTILASYQNKPLITVTSSAAKFGEQIQERYIKEGMYCPATPTNGYYSITDCEAMIGSVYYNTLEDALKNAKDNDTIVLNANVVLDEPVDVPVAVTIDANGKTVSGVINASKALTVKNEKGYVTAPNGGIATNLTKIQPNADPAYAWRATLIENGNFWVLEPGTKAVLAKNGTVSFNGGDYLPDVNKNGKPEISIVFSSSKKVVDHDNVHWRNTDGDMIIKCGGFLPGCEKITITNNAGVVVLTANVNNEEYKDTYCTVKEGSTVMTLKASWLNSQIPGTYTVTFAYEDGATAEGTLYVVDAVNYQADPTNPKTGDSILLSTAVMFTSAAALFVLLMNKKKRA